ncbi:hypothetical protein THASP1DRAFT_30681 [Thamnocephalis sphaerospora]|uniref:Uncharacterized protein n=1 Tax=Thamnocephalis sphaerospora TaxID=78915 RepID=A0A4P9XNE9_9FUNG|nr:hypothetical protein THASP1DRAFT_30681 [Thamnocephalis sphaerospora]|eukprot:RKP07497.1 hypothetical protein THASP1DRAFT_30681 [Thamnocephalis sphaerospora]
MSNNKADLKRAKEALGAKRFEDALRICERILLFDGLNLQARVMAGAALFQLERYPECEQTLQRALDTEKSAVALQGLVNLYEKQNRTEDLMSTLQQLLEMHRESKNAARLLETLKKRMQLIEKEEDPEKTMEAWRLYLPGSLYWPVIQEAPDRPSELSVWRAIAAIQEALDTAFITRENETRRRRIGAGTPAQIKAQVMREIQASSKLEECYGRLLALEKDPETRASLRARYLDRLAARLPVAPADEKPAMRELLDKLVLQQLATDAPTQCALEITIDNANVADVALYDDDLLARYVSLYADTPMAAVIQRYQEWLDAGYVTDELFEAYVSATQSLLGESVLAAHTFSWLCHAYGDYAGGNEIVGKALATVDDRVETTGRPLDLVRRSLQLCKAHCMRELGGYQVSAALSIYETLLKQDSEHVDALYGKGAALLQLGQYAQAHAALAHAYEKSEQRTDILAQLGWARHRLGDSETAVVHLKTAVDACPDDGQQHLTLGRVFWEMDDAHRNDKTYAYAEFIQAVQLDPSLSDAFTLLGHYYRQVEKDQQRAIKCYQKAFSLNAEDIEAADHLTAHMLRSGRADDAEALLRSVTAAGTRTAWVWRRLGTIELQSGRSAEAIGSLQRALRDDSNDARAWEALAEAYSQQGRYTAAIKAYARASELDASAYHALIGMANVYLRLGLHAEAVARFQSALDSNGQPDGICSTGVAAASQLPALQGLADAYALAGRDNLANGFYGRAAEDCEHALATVCRIAAVKERRLRCAWKTAGDVCITAAQLSAYHGAFLVDTVCMLVEQACSSATPLLRWTLQQLDIESNPVDSLTWSDALSFNRTMLRLAAVAYACALRGWEDAELCCDLSWTLFRLHRLQSDTSDQCLRAAVDCTRAGLKHNANSALLWNALGVYTMRMAPKVCQHALIQAIRADDKDAMAWANLGHLYLRQGDLELAAQAFTSAQTIDPECIAAWTGRALLSAERTDDESLQLFEHALDLAMEPSRELVCGVGQQWLRLAASPNTLPTSPIPLFALRKYLERQPDDTAAWNLYTLLLEWADLRLRALSANDAALASSEAHAASVQQVLTENRGRLLCSLHDFSAAVDTFSRTDASGLAAETATADGSTAISYVVRGIAHFFNHQLDESLGMFEQALAAAADDERQRSRVVLGLSQVLWALGTPDHRELAKQQLFSVLGEQLNLDGVACLFVIGLLCDDATLTTAALGELMNTSADALGHG